MQFRRAAMEDLPQIKSAYREIVQNMRENQIDIWDEIYPFDFFAEDIRRGALYLLLEQGEIAGAFALCGENEGAAHLGWERDAARAVYLDRLGVRPGYAGKGLASQMLAKAKEQAKGQGAEYLRLFVVDCNRPAIRLYEKNGFRRARGVYDEVIEEGYFLREYGYEAAL